VRSGCSCEVTPKPRKRKLAAMKVKRTRSSRARSRFPVGNIYVGGYGYGDLANSSAEV
jgi:hypothetical protein